MKGDLLKNLLALVTLVALAAELPASARDTSARAGDPLVVKSRKGVPLTHLGQGNERELIVETDASPPLLVEAPPGTGELEWLASISPAILTIRIERIESSLTDDRDWIDSSVQAIVLDVLKQPAAITFAPGSIVTFEMDAGELDVAGRRIRAVLPWTALFRTGHDYLVFAALPDAAGTVLIAPESAFEITGGGRLRPLTRRGRLRRETGVPIEQAIERIRAAPQREGVEGGALGVHHDTVRAATRTTRRAFGVPPTGD